MNEKKRKQTMKIIMGDFLMLFSVVTIVVTLVFITQGWTLDKGSAQQTGLVQFASKPTGATVEETEANIREAIAFHLEGLRGDGLPIPPARSHVEYVDIAA